MRIQDEKRGPRQPNRGNRVEKHSNRSESRCPKDLCARTV